MQIIRPRRQTKPSQAQKSVNRNFIVATAYAKSQMADPVRKALYQEGITNTKQSAYIVAMTDALTAPVVHEIDTSAYNGAVGNIITITATDDFKVERLKVSITNSDDTELESGDAMLDKFNPFKWDYVARVVNPDIKGTKILATAFDNPGNQAALEKVLVQSACAIASLKIKRKPRKLHLQKSRVTKR